MRQTLFFIPHDAFGLPVFGFGWLLIACVLLSTVLLIWLVRRHGFGAETRSYVPVLLLIAFVIVFLLPQLELRTPDGRLSRQVRGDRPAGARRAIRSALGDISGRHG